LYGSLKKVLTSILDFLRGLLVSLKNLKSKRETKSVE
jgi:hypothetical protein